LSTAQSLGLASDPQSAFLSTLTADARHRRLAGQALLVSVVIFLAAAPFARTALPQVPAFIPIYQSALITNDLITAVLLLGQFSFLRSRALLVLATGYLFSAGMAIAHALSFPGLFAPTGAMGAGPQTTAWLYFLWHGGFPLFIIASVRLNYQATTIRPLPPHVVPSTKRAILVAIACALSLCLALVGLTTVGHDALPVLMRGNTDDSGKALVAFCTWMISLAALVYLWRQRAHSVLDLWLMVSLVSWLFDIALASVLNGGRFDVGFYFGRVYGLMASSFVLVVLLLENGRLYADLASANARERMRNAELEQARNEARAAAQVKSDFLATMSHEIRTPMNGVIGMIDVLARSSLKTHQVAMVDLIRESAFALLTIIDDILDFSKIEAGRMEIEREPMAVAQVVEKVCAMLNRLAEKQGVELTLFTDPAIADSVLGDALRLRQVLINLVNNAIKFSAGARPTGRVAVRALLASREPQRVVIAFQIADNGIGMTEATLSNLFAAFTQADVSTTRRFGGTGLGLAISHKLASLMGGSISVVSAPNAGSTFTLRLPFATVPAQQAAHPPSSLVSDLQCVVIGNSDSVSADWMSYLGSAGAQTQLAIDLEAVRTLVPTLSPGVWVWIVNTFADAPASVDHLRAAARTNPGLDVRFVVIRHGPDRYPEQFDADRVSVDGNVLTRGALLRAVAIAAGRARQEDEQCELAPTQSAPVPVALSREEARRSGRLILVVEDNDINQKVILQQLTLLGLTADLACDGLQALIRWRSGDYALIVTDLHMPGMDGYQLASVVRSEERESANVQMRAGRVPDHRIPIIALTANALKSEAQRCRAAGMDDYMSKPIPLADLQILLEKWLPHAKAATGSHATVGGDADADAAPSSAPLDVQVLSQLVGNDPSVIADFLQSFRDSAARTARELHLAHSAGNASATVAAVHKLKSAARSVGAMRLGNLCADMEQAGSAGQLDALALAFEHFKSEMAVVDNHLAEILRAVGQEQTP